MFMGFFCFTSWHLAFRIDDEMARLPNEGAEFYMSDGPFAL